MGLSGTPAGPESIETVVMPQNPIVPANTSPQPMSSTDPLSPAVASCKPSSSTSAMTSVPLSVPSNSTRPVFAQLPLNNTDVPIAVIVSLEELAILQALRQRQATSSLVEIVAEPLNGPSRDREPHVHQSPPTLPHQFPPSVAQSTSSTLPLHPHSHANGPPSHSSVTLDPLLNVAHGWLSRSPFSVSSRLSHSPHLPFTIANRNVPSPNLATSVDGPVEPDLKPDMLWDGSPHESR
ncbi:hypothetical protein BDN67DRAFT_699719 [Paxillus ammoniavirescens]|nr:hypothetical protein BDN67DRAFT_699719 [Paxillus ammoniavirescens]